MRSVHSVAKLLKNNLKINWFQYGKKLFCAQITVHFYAFIDSCLFSNTVWFDERALFGIHENMCLRFAASLNVVLSLQLNNGMKFNLLPVKYAERKEKKIYQKIVRLLAVNRINRACGTQFSVNTVEINRRFRIFCASIRLIKFFSLHKIHRIDEFQLRDSNQCVVSVCVCVSFVIPFR